MFGLSGIEAEGDKAFCAGGDIVALYRSMTEPQSGSGASEGIAFFTEEYEMDYLIHSTPKPVVCWGHGIVMGGGIGIMAGASHRVVTKPLNWLCLKAVLVFIQT